MFSDRATECDLRLTGRPSIYTKALAKEICDRLSEGELLKDICASDGMPERTTVWNWAEDNVKENSEDENEEGFFNLYTRARRSWRKAQSEKCHEIADDCDDGNPAAVRKAELRIKTRQWAIERQDDFSLKHSFEHSGPGGAPLPTQIQIILVKPGEGDGDT